MLVLYKALTIIMILFKSPKLTKHLKDLYLKVKQMFLFQNIWLPIPGWGSVWHWIPSTNKLYLLCIQQYGSTYSRSLCWPPQSRFWYWTWPGKYKWFDVYKRMVALDIFILNFFIFFYSFLIKYVWLKFVLPKINLFKGILYR